MKPVTLGILLSLGCSLLAPAAWSLDDRDGTASECEHFNPERNPYFGDTHIHTTFSVDAFTQGVETTPEQAYQFASSVQGGRARVAPG